MSLSSADVRGVIGHPRTTSIWTHHAATKNNNLNNPLSAAARRPTGDVAGDEDEGSLRGSHDVGDLTQVQGEDVGLTAFLRSMGVPSRPVGIVPLIALQQEEPWPNAYELPAKQAFDSVLSLVRHSNGALVRRSIVEREDVDDGHLTAFFRRMDVSAWVPARRGQGPCVCVGRLYCV